MLQCVPSEYVASDLCPIQHYVSATVSALSSSISTLRNGFAMSRISHMARAVDDEEPFCAVVHVLASSSPATIMMNEQCVVLTNLPSHHVSVLMLLVTATEERRGQRGIRINRGLSP